MQINYEKLDFLAEINAVQTLKRELSQGEDAQKPLFTLKNATKILNVLIENRMYAKTDSSIDRLIAFGDQELLEKFLQNYQIEGSKHQLFFLNHSNITFAKRLLRRSELTPEAQSALIALNNRKLLDIYIYSHSFDRPQAKMFFETANDELMAKYIINRNYDLNPYKHGRGYMGVTVTHFSPEADELLKAIEEIVFTKENPLAIKAYCKYFTISQEKYIPTLLKPENEEAFFVYLKREISGEWLLKTKDRRVFEYYVFQKQYPLSEEPESQLFEFDDAEEWLQKYIKYRSFSPKNEMRLLEPKYAELFNYCVQNGKLYSAAVQLELFSDKYRPLLRDYIIKHCCIVTPSVELRLFELEDNNELLKLYIEKRRRLSEEAQQRLFKGSDNELKLYYLQKAGQDK